MERCAQCESQSDLKRCKACLTTWYCSRECQLRHWKRHKVTCAKTGGKGGAAKRGKPNDDGEKGGAQAAGGAAQSESKSREKGTATDKEKKNLVMLNFEYNTCQNCGRKAPGMKMCGQCGKGTYCSRDCQKQNWKQHKVDCLEVITTDGYRRTEQREQEQLFSRRPFQPDTFLLSERLASISVGPSLSWEDARSRAKRLYPKQRVVECFRDLDTDLLGRPDTRGVVAVALITGVYPHVFRHGRSLQDSEGNASFVLFYNKEDPQPYFRYEQLRDGNFFCLEHAHLHFFADGTVGFRVDEPRHVHIMEPG